MPFTCDSDSRVDAGIPVALAGQAGICRCDRVTRGITELTSSCKLRQPHSGMTLLVTESDTPAKRCYMAFVHQYNVALPVIAAFVISVLGYLTLFVSLMICLAIAKGLYEGAMEIRAFAMRSAWANSSIPSGGQISPHREKRIVIPA